MEKLTYQEEEAMRFIWNLGPCFVKDVVGCYAEPKPLKCTENSCQFED